MGIKDTKRDIAIFISIMVASLILFHSVRYFEVYIYQIFQAERYLGWHIALELLSIVMTFSVFFVSYYTFERTYRVRTLIANFVFLAISLLDIFHLMDYKGMPSFFSAASAPKATTFWIASRLTFAIGFVIIGFIPYNKTWRMKRYIFPGAAILYSFVIYYIVTFRLDTLPPLFIEGVGLTRLKINLEYLIIGMQLITTASFLHTYFNYKEAEGYNYLIISMILSILCSMTLTLYTSVYDTYNLLGHVYKVASYYMLFRSLFVLYIQRPYINLKEAERKISHYAQNLEQLVETRTSEIREANAKILNDLDYARNIQSALLPGSFPKLPELDFAAKYMPCEKIGGDFYNVFKLDDDNIGLLIGDVAGHGVSAAMVTVFINQNIYVRREYDDGHVRVLTPKQVLTNLYHIYNRMSFPEEVYTVLFYGIYNLRDKTLTYSSAGMNTSPLILNKDGGISAIEIKGLPICKLGSSVSPGYENKVIQLSVGDSLILFTDGLIEIDRKRPEQFDEHNLMEFLRGVKDATAAEVAEHMVDVYHAILRDEKMIDDVTVLITKINQ